MREGRLLHGKYSRDIVNTLHGALEELGTCEERVFLRSPAWGECESAVERGGDSPRCELGVAVWARSSPRRSPPRAVHRRPPGAPPSPSTLQSPAPSVLTPLTLSQSVSCLRLPPSAQARAMPAHYGRARSHPRPFLPQSSGGVAEERGGVLNRQELRRAGKGIKSSSGAKMAKAPES